MEILIGWVILSAIVGWLATTKGRSFAGWMLLSLLVSPLFGLLVLVVAGGGKPKRAETIARIGELAQLRSNGAISDAEYEAKKAELLARV